jgi:hypothetical protein
MDTFQKQPDEILDYDADFSAFLAVAAPDTLVSAVATVSEGITDDDQTDYLDNSLPIPDYLTIDTTIVTDTIVKVWLSLGRTGQKYKITIVATTAAGRVKEHDFRVRVREI